MSFFDFVLYFIGASLLLSFGVPLLFMVIAAPFALIGKLFDRPEKVASNINQRRPGANGPPMEL